MWCLIDLHNNYRGILFDNQSDAYLYGKKHFSWFRVIQVEHI
jgi:hypothetical protein